MTNTQSRAPYCGTDPKDGTQVVFVPLANGKGVARILPADFERLSVEGFTMKWALNSNGRGGRSYVRAYQANASGTHVTLARVIARAMPGERVWYRDGDPTNLREDNLRGARGFAGKDGTALEADGLFEQKAVGDMSYAPGAVA